MKYKVIAEGIDGTNIGDIIEREPHVMEYHVKKGQVEVYIDTVKEIKEPVKKQKKIKK